MHIRIRSFVTGDVIADCIEVNEIPDKNSEVTLEGVDGYDKSYVWIVKRVIRHLKYTGNTSNNGSLCRIPAVTKPMYIGATIVIG